MQTYRLCVGVLNFSKKYSRKVLETTCKQAVEDRKISYSYIKNIIAAVAEEEGSETYNSMGGEKIVKILSPEDKAKIEAYCENAKTPIELRDAAILRIGMDTALRASDIVSLRKGNIDWKNKFIQFDQSKTRREHLHPVTNRTLNAILRYRRDGITRKGSTDFIFLSTQAPYRPISPVACNYAMRRAGCSVTDFHRIRRTYATDTLKSGATIKETAELLGQSDTSTVHKYVVLDDERMRLCPLSLSETGLALKGRYADD